MFIAIFSYIKKALAPMSPAADDDARISNKQIVCHCVVQLTTFGKRNVEKSPGVINLLRQRHMMCSYCLYERIIWTTRTSADSENSPNINSLG